MSRARGATGVADVPEIRHEVAAYLTSLGVNGELTDTAVLLLSELLTNAITHGEHPVRCATTVTDHREWKSIQIQVWDASPHPPVLKAHAPDSESGRGLQLVEKLASRWGWRPSAGGKCTWCEVEG